jgi:dTMP kinase
MRNRSVPPDIIRAMPAARDILPLLRGRFIALEGLDGAGKTTQWKRLMEACAAAGSPACGVRDPGGTPIGERVRAILLDQALGPMSPRCELMLFMASRAQLIEERVRPALARGEPVIADRFLASTLAYQGAGEGLPVDHIETVARTAVGDTRPDLTLVFDVDEMVAADRIGLRQRVLDADAAGDRIEARGLAFRRRVRACYRALCERNPARFALIDATGDAEAVWQELLTTLGARLRPRAGG